MRFACRATALVVLGITLGASASSHAQIVCHAENDGPDFEDFSSTGTALFAIQFDVGATMKVRGASIFTGEKVGTMSLAIYDDVGGFPGAAQASLSFASQLANDFQGGDLDHPIVLKTGVTYWLVWGTIAGAQSPTTPPQAENGQPFRVSVDGGATWGDVLQSPERHFKFRLSCDCPSLATQFGDGCDGSGSFVPELRAEECAIAGSTLSITIDQALGGSSALLFFGLGQGAAPILGTDCSLVVLPLLPLVVNLPLAGVGPGAGTITVFGALPPSVAGATFNLQSLIPDAGVARGFAATNALGVFVY